MIQNISLESKLLLTMENKGMSVFTTDDAKEILKTTDSSVWHILHGLAQKKRIERIERGRYLLIPARAGIEGYWDELSQVIVPCLIDTYYIGFYSAMHFWDMTEQIPYTVFVATTQRKRNLKFRYHRYEFVTLSDKKFFGFIEQKTIKKKSFNISSREKTLIDGLMYPEYCGGMIETTKAMWNVRNEVDWDKVLEMAEKTEFNTVLKRLGYLLTVLDIEEKISEKIKKKIKIFPYSYLDSMDFKKKIHTSKEYGLILNLTKDNLLEWMDY